MLWVVQVTSLFYGEFESGHKNKTLLFCVNVCKAQSQERKEIKLNASVDSSSNKSSSGGCC